MAKVTNRAELRDYCLRRLGFPVIEINVDCDQIEDRICDALEIYYDYHYNATESKFYSIQLTQEIIDQGYIELPEEMIFVTRVLPISSSGSGLGFNSPLGQGSTVDVSRAFPGIVGASGGSFGQRSSIQNRAGSQTTLSATSFAIGMQYISMLRDTFSTTPLCLPVVFNRHTNRISLNIEWDELEVGCYLVIEGLSALDPEIYTDVYNDRWLKRYATALIKRQWGANLIKYSGVQLPGGVTLDGDKLYSQAIQEIDELEEELQSKYESPPLPFVC